MLIYVKNFVSETRVHVDFYYFQETKQDSNSSNKPAVSVDNNQLQTAQKNQKAVKQRRSRVAAKFQSDPLANGGDKQ